MVRLPGMFTKVENYLYYYRAELVRVIDGDSIVVDIDWGAKIWSKNAHLRLLGINAPELRGESRDRGIEAKEALAGMLTDALLVRTHKTGKYGRWLADVWTIDDDGNKGLHVNREMVLRGHADAVEY